MTLRRRAIIIIATLVALLVAIPGMARKVKVPTDTKHARSAATTLRTFTVDSASTEPAKLSDIAFSRFDKPVESRNETFLATNNTDYRLLKISIRIEYQLPGIGRIHQRNLVIDCDIPPHQTRQLSVRSFDTQQTYRYSGSRVPPRRKAEPFDVKLTATAHTFAR